MKTQIFTKLIIFFIFLSISLVSYSTNYYVNDASTAGDVYCTVTGSGSADGLTKAKPLNSLSAVLSKYSGAFVFGDTIFVDAGNYKADLKLSSPLNGVVIQGAGANLTIFTGKGPDKYFMHINDNKTVVRDLQVNNYQNDASGGPSAPIAQVFEIAPNITGIKIINVMHSKNASNGSDSDYPFLVNSGAQVEIIGGGTLCNDQSGVGGGIHVLGTSTKLDIYNYLFFGDARAASQSTYGGGALLIEDGNVNIYNSRFQDNGVSGSITGAAIYQLKGNLNIYDSYFDNNSYNWTDAMGSSVAGGCIRVSGGIFKIKRSIISSTKKGSIAVNGGGIGVTGGNVYIDSCLFKGNEGKNGNDIYIVGGSSTVSIFNSTFNSSPNQIVVSSGSISISNSGSPAGPSAANFIDNIAPSYIPKPKYPDFKGNCPSGIKICETPVSGGNQTVTCPATTATMSVTGVKSKEIFYWYTNQTRASKHFDSISNAAWAAKKFWFDTSSTSTPSVISPTITANTTFYVVSGSDACSNPVAINVVYDCPACQPPTIPNFPTSACPKDTIKYITQSGQTNYVWTIPGVLGTDYEIIPPGKSTSDTLVLKWLTTGDKVVTVAYKDASNCTAISDNTNKTSVGSLSTGVFTIQPSANSCQNTPIKYAANKTNKNFKWLIDNNTGTAGIDYEILAGGKTTDDTLIIIWKTLGNHKVELDYTASGGCATTTPASNTTKVVARPKFPLSPFQDTVHPICTLPTGSVLLNLPSSGNWTISSLPAVGNAKVVNNLATYRFGDLLKKTQYKFFIVDANGCYSDTTSEVTMNDIPGQPEITGVSTLCMDSTLTLRAWVKGKVNTTQSSPNAIDPWVSSDNTIADITNSGLVKAKKKSGKVIFTYKDAANCIQIDSIQIAPKTESGLTTFTLDTICETTSTTIVLSNSSTTDKIQWQDSILGNWKNIQNENSTTLNTPTSLVAGNYYYRAVVKNGFCNQYDTSKVIKVVVIGLPAPTFVDTIQPTCTVATGGVTTYMQYAGVWTIKATDLSVATKDTTAKLLNPPFSLTIKGLKPGTYTFQVKSSKGCFSTVSSPIVIDPQPTIPAKPVLDADSIYCASNTYTLDKIYFDPKPVAPLTVKYFDKNGFQITTPNLEKVKPTEDYMFVFDNGSCTSKDTLITKIPMDNGPTTLVNPIVFPPLPKICAIIKPTFDSIFKMIPNPPFSLPTGYSYFISPNASGIPILPNNTVISANNGANQTFYYTLANQNGCKNINFAPLTFKLDEGPKNLNIKSSQLFCGFSNPTVAKLDTAATKASTTNSFVWYTTSTSLTPLLGNTPLVSGVYYGAEKENPGCESVERKQVVVTIENFGQTTVDPNNVYAFCKGSNKKVSDLPITPYSATNFVWLDSYKKEIKDKTIALIQGTYYAAEFKNGCISDQSQAIDVKFESPIISISPSKLPTCGVGNGAFKIVGAEQTFTYEWQKNNVLMPDNGDQISNLPSDYTIKYSVIVKDLKGCMAYDTASFSDCEPPGIPHVITLNKDGKNDVFKLHYDTKYPKCKLSIFNRWGAMVYESKEMPYKDDWDGKPNVAGTLGSGELPTGTYFYLIDKGDGSALESGYVELVK